MARPGIWRKLQNLRLFADTTNKRIRRGRFHIRIARLGLLLLDSSVTMPPILTWMALLSDRKRRFGLATLVLLVPTLRPASIQAQVIIDEKVAIEDSSGSDQDTTAARWAYYVDHSTDSARKGTGQQQAITCDHRDLSTFVPCIGTLFDLAPKCPCEAGTCPSDVIVQIEMLNQVTEEQTFTWEDGTTDPKSTPTSEMIIDGTLFLVGDTVNFVSQNGYGVVQFRFSDSQGACTPGTTPDIPTDTDDDQIADPWELANGGKSTANPQATCDVPSPECTELDLIWDEETSTIIVNDHDGDNVTKVLEYRGVKIGERHKRLSPERKEIFIAFDPNFESDEITWVVGELTSQLDIDVQRIGGYYAGFGDRILGNPDSIMKWLGPIEPSRNVVLMPKKDVPFPGGTTATQRLLNGIYVQFGIYTVSNLYAGSSDCNNSLENCRAPEFKNQKRKMVFGSISPPLETGRGVEARVYDGVISNFYSTNSIPENVKHRFKWVTIGTSGLAVPWYAMYSNRDLNGSGGPPFQDDVNPFDIMSPSKVSNDIPPDGDVAGRSDAQQLRTTMLHELGHALGLKHPTSSTTTSVMRKGIGPGKSTNFSSKDKRSFRFKSPTTN